MNKAVVSLSSGVTFLATLAFGCSSDPKAPAHQITMGVVLDRTGSLGLIAIPEVVKLALADVNGGIAQAGGFKDVGFNQTEADVDGSADRAGQLATALVQAGAKLVITDNSNDTVSVMKVDYDGDVTNDLNVPILCTLCSSPSINNPAATHPDATTQMALRNSLKWNFRVIMASRFLSPIVAARAMNITGGDRNGDGIFKVSLYGSNEPQGTGALNGFEAAIKALVPTVSIEKIFQDPAADPNGTLWAEDARRVTDDQNETTGTVDGVPDLIFESSLPTGAIAFTKAYVQGGYTIPLLHGAPFGNETAIIALGNLANGQEGVGYATYYPGHSGDFFVARYTGEFGKPPQSHERDGATTYDAVTLGALATLIAVKDMTDPTLVTGGQIRDALSQVNDPAGTAIFAGPDEFAKAVKLIRDGMPINYQGVSGPVDFDQSGFVMGAMAHWTIENSRFKDLVVYGCAGDPTCPVIAVP